ncbi:3'-5' exonuclease [Leptolyngbya ohadii]|uniref:3'-5' exonuclease n=1 Tax=Leptolyngbya ohadii TaxID=1962290 RepID=UPI001CEDFD3C|nr:3'-5' exonuclease [Leptolyngbya ohadii]
MRSIELIQSYRQLSQQVFAVVDVETTGRYCRSDRVTEVSVIRATLEDGVVEQQTSLINPQTRIPAQIVRFTGITQSMVNAAPIAAEVLPNFYPLLSQGILTAHNLSFDYGFLQAEYDRLGTVFDKPKAEQLCTVQLSRLMLPDLPSRSLPKLVEHFQFEVGRSHRAAADTMACWLLLKRLMQEILNESDDVLMARFRRQWMPLKYAAIVLNCSPGEAQRQLDLANVKVRFVGRNKKEGTWMYLRGDVERVWETMAETQA